MTPRAALSLKAMMADGMSPIRDWPALRPSSSVGPPGTVTGSSPCRSISVWKAARRWSAETAVPPSTWTMRR